MVEKTEHMATPWKIYCDTDRYPGLQAAGNKTVVIFGNEGEEAGVRGRTPEEALANAAFIVRAVNAHDDLVRAIDGLLLCGEPNEWTNAARAALAKAKATP